MKVAAISTSLSLLRGLTVRSTPAFGRGRRSQDADLDQLRRATPWRSMQKDRIIVAGNTTSTSTAATPTLRSWRAT